MSSDGPPVRPDGDPPPGPVPSVYVHAPFCARRCVYCDFAVTVAPRGDVDGWLEALSAEWEGVTAEPDVELAPRLSTLYVGGGTPSLLGPTAMSGLRDVLGSSLLSSPELEWTAEANPESLTPEVAGAWAEAGVNRLSLGVQSLHPEALRWMGRLHGPEGAVRAVETARSAGITNLSVDLLFGLPTRIGRSWESDLRRVAEWEVPHVSLYGLTVEEGTPLGRAVAAGREEVADEERYREEYLLAFRILEEAGYRAYEVSNFALPGFESGHNRRYWDGTPYLGLGNGAHSYVPPVRRWNLRDWHAYRKAALAGRPPLQDEERLGPGDRRLERIWLGLRTRRGLHRPSLPEAARSRVREWEREGLATCPGQAVRLTPEGWLLLDRLAVELDEAHPSSD